MPEAREALIRRIFSEAYGAGDFSVLSEAYAGDYLRHQPPVPSLEGLEAYRQFIHDTRSAYAGLEFTLDEIIDHGDRSVVRVTLKGKHTGQAPTILAPPTGKQIEMAGCIVSHWKAGARSSHRKAELVEPLLGLLDSGVSEDRRFHGLVAVSGNLLERTVVVVSDDIANRPELQTEGFHEAAALLMVGGSLWPRIY